MSSARATTKSGSSGKMRRTPLTTYWPKVMFRVSLTPLSPRTIPSPVDLSFLLKHAAQQSPYRNLLKPKAGGVAFVLAALGDNLDALLDVTVVYPDGKTPGFWDLLSGKVQKVIVDVRTCPLEPRLWRSDYQDDPVFREEIQQWVSELWQQKDARIEVLRGELQRPQ